MSDVSDFLEAKFLEITLKGAAAYNVATPYVAIYTSNPDEDNSGTECSYVGYARQAGTFGTITDDVATDAKTVSTTLEVNYPILVGSDITVTHVGIFDALTSGNLLYYTVLDTAKSVQTDDVLSFAAGEVTVKID